MNRREMIELLGSVAVVWPLAARAQQQTMPVVGFLNSTSPGPWTRYVDAFRGGLKSQGFAEGQNVAIEFRWAEGRYDRLPALAADLVDRQVAVLVATGGSMTALAAKAATTKIPIVFSIGEDPVELGIVESLNRPGGNITGVNIFTSEMNAKRLGLLHEMVPTAALMASLINPKNPTVQTLLKELPEAARSVAQRIHILTATTEQELDAAFKSMTDLGAGALLVAADPYFNSRREYIVALAARHGMPAMYEQREFALAGGLMSYGTKLSHGYRQAGIYVGRILKGEKPADLPVVQSTEFEFVINLNAAKALGLEVPPGLSERADEVIE
jgi:putative ABC transport system substrate-binding protein